jgi:hypothetical protein
LYVIGNPENIENVNFIVDKANNKHDIALICNVFERKLNSNKNYKVTKSLSLIQSILLSSSLESADFINQRLKTNIQTLKKYLNPKDDSQDESKYNTNT